MCVCLFVLCLVVDEDDDGKRFILNGIVLKIEREREKIGAVRRNVFIRTQIVKSRLPAYLKLVPIYIGFVARKRTSQGDEQKAQNSERRIGVGALQWSRIIIFICLILPLRLAAILIAHLTNAFIQGDAL